MPFLKDLLFINDIKQVHETHTINVIKENTQFSLSYIILLVSSTIITTLGLLMNSSPIVIGGMIISPLMWPLMKIAVGVSYEKKSYLREALSLLVLSILVSLASSYLITIISPIKLINDEIILRTNPNFIDIVVALSGGAVAALGLVQTRISQNLAGVAIATSLMPPLCVSGIGLALSDYNVSFGGLVLFLANIVAIIFVSVLIFTLVGIKSEQEVPLFKRRGIVFITVILILTSIPLFFFMRTYAFRNVAFNQVQTVLQEDLQEISPSIYVSNIETRFLVKSGQEVVSVDAEINLPGDVSLNYEQQQDLRGRLEEALGRSVDLNLILLRTISIVTEEDIQVNILKKDIRESLARELGRIESGFEVDSMQISDDRDEEGEWVVDMVVYGDPLIVFTDIKKTELEKNVEEVVEDKIKINMNIIPLVTIKSDDDLQSQEVDRKVKSIVTQAFKGLNGSVEVSSIDFESEEDIYKVKVEIRVNSLEDVKEGDLQFIKNILQNEFSDKEIEFSVTVIEKKELNI